MSDHTVKAYDRDLEALDRKISEMGGIAEKMLSDAMDALSTFDLALAQQVVSTDHRLDVLQREIEEGAILTIARRQPLAVDLRECIGAIRISGDLERVGDLAKNIARRTTKLVDEARTLRAIIGLKSMHDLAAMQLKEVLDAYAQRDVEARPSRLAERRRSRLSGRLGVPRPPHLHDGGSAQHLLLHASPLLLEEFGAYRRSHHEHRRDHRLSRHRRAHAD